MHNSGDKYARTPEFRAWEQLAARKLGGNRWVSNENHLIRQSESWKHLLFQQPASVWSLLFVFSASWGSWVIRGFWIMLLYVQAHRDESFAMTLPISPLRLVYVRLATSGALVVAALFLNPLARLFHQPVQVPGLVDSLLTVAAGLLMVVTVKLIRWHRLRRIPRRVIVLAPVLLFFLAATSIWPNYVTSALDSWRPEQAVPTLVGVIALMLWLMAVETRETDYFAVPLGGRER